MINNNEKHHDHKDSLGSAIRTVSHPFITLQEKADVVTDKWNRAEKAPLEAKKEAWRGWFKAYYENEALYNHYGLTVIEPW